MALFAIPLTSDDSQANVLDWSVSPQQSLVHNASFSIAELRVSFSQSEMSVNEGDGTVTVSIALLDVVEPTEAAIWLTLEILNMTEAVCKTMIIIMHTCS